MNLSGISNPFGAPVYRFEAVESTMTEAMRLSDQGKAPHGTVVMADFQGAGQGRTAGRRWESPPGESLLFTLILGSDTAGDPAAVPYSLLAGLAVCRALETLCPDTRVKWPNDVLLDGRKCAGILCRARGRNIHIGVGINCLQRNFCGDYNYRPTSVLEASGVEVSPAELLPRVLEECQRLLAEGWNPEVFNRSLYGIGSLHVVRVGIPRYERELRGIIVGVGEKGDLLLRNSQTGVIQSIATGEIPEVEGG